MTKKSILVVDDEKNIRMTLTQALDSKDVKVETALNGEEALEKLSDHPFALVLLDLRMPGMDGMEVLRKIRASWPDVRVIIISAHGTIESATEAMKLGAVDFIEKPFAPKEIRELVQRVMQRESLDPSAAGSYDEYVELAKKAINQGDLDAAYEHVREAARIDPSKPEAQNLTGAITEIRGDWLTALKHYRAAMALDPTYKPADANVERIVSRHEKARDISLDESDHPGKGRT